MRSDDAADIRALLQSEADNAPRPAGMSRANLRRGVVQRMEVAFASVFAIVVVLAGVGFAATWVTSDRDPINPSSGGWVAIADVEQLQSEGVVYDPSHRAFAVWNEGQPLVLSALVPHIPGQEERALFCTTSQTFDGPHAERFDVRGYYYGGPARHGLDRYESRVQDGVVQFAPQELMAGPTRGEGPALEPAGPFCTEDHTEREPGFAATADPTTSRLPTPPASLRAELPRHMRFYLGDDLVLLFRRGDKYHSFHEGLLPHSCPVLLDEPDTYEELLERHRGCIGTALHRIVPVDGPVPSTEKGSHDLELPHLRSSDEIIWRGVPHAGYIGIDSSGACDRIQRFAPDYVCRDGEIVLVAKRA